MRWVKHQTATARDEKMARFLEETGLAGYGFYWRLLETVAEQIGPGDTVCSVTYTPRQWCRLLVVHHHRLRTTLGTLEKHGLVSHAYGEGSLTVRMPNIAKYRDEYSRKSGRSPDIRPTVSHSETEAEKEKEREGRNGHYRDGRMKPDMQHIGSVGLSRVSSEDYLKRWPALRQEN